MLESLEFKKVKDSWKIEDSTWIMRERADMGTAKVDFLENSHWLEVVIFMECKGGSKESKTIIFSKRVAVDIDLFWI